MGGVPLFARLEYPRGTQVPSQMEMNAEHLELRKNQRPKSGDRASCFSTSTAQTFAELGDARCTELPPLMEME